MLILITKKFELIGQVYNIILINFFKCGHHHNLASGPLENVSGSLSFIPLMFNFIVRVI
jgi:hypothetical protein